jgi:hypothetical protein
MRVRHVLIGLALLAAGCGSSHASATAPPSSTPTPNGTLSATVAPAPILTPVQAAGAPMCRQLEAYPPFTTTAAARKYADYLLRQAARRDVSAWLSSVMAKTGTDLLAFVNGLTSEAQVKRDAARLEAACTSYGVTG